MSPRDLVKFADKLDALGKHVEASIVDVRLAQLTMNSGGSTHLPSGAPATVQTDNTNVQNILSRFIKSNQPVFFNSFDGQQYLVIHGSPVQNGTMTFNGGTDGPIAYEDLPQWITSKGKNPASIRIMACHAGQVTELPPINGVALRPAFDNKGTLQISVPQDGSGNEIQFSV